MAAPPLVCTKEEQSDVICFICAEGMQGAEIHLHLCARSEDIALSWRSVCSSIEMFKKSQTVVTGESAQDVPQHVRH
jgi:hypothetical protein